MKIFTNTSRMRPLISKWRQAGERIAIVPTMGGLHEGHLSLVRFAREQADRVVATVYVNPTQFAEGEDFQEYPRDLDSDAAKLESEGVDILYAPDTESIYPYGISDATRITVPGLASELCGNSRPGHFDGVTTVVARLFLHVQPDVAVFGQKDFQQLILIRRMVHDLRFPIEVLQGWTVREANGLAMSSRNEYLNDADRERAAAIYRTLQSVHQQLLDGDRDFAAIEQRATETLLTAVDEVEYLSIRHTDLTLPEADSWPLVVLVAAKVAGVRLIDNILFDL